MLTKLRNWLMTQSSINGFSAIAAGAALAYIQPNTAVVYVPMIVGGLVSLGMPQVVVAPVTKTAEDAIAAAASGGAAGAVAALKADAPADIAAIAPLVMKSTP